MKKFILPVAVTMFCVSGLMFAEGPSKNVKENEKMNSEVKLYAAFDTSMGKIVCELF